MNATLAGAGVTSWHDAVGGKDAGGATVGAGDVLTAGLGVGAAVGEAVAEAVGVGVGAADALALGDAEALADGEGFALAEALGLADGSGVVGFTSATRMLPFASVRLSPSLRRSTLPTPCMALMNACSWAMTSSGHASRVVASGPMATTLPFVV